MRCLSLLAIVLAATLCVPAAGHAQTSAEGGPSTTDAEGDAAGDATPSTAQAGDEAAPAEGVAGETADDEVIEEIPLEDVVEIDPALLHQRPESTLINIHAALGTTALVAFGSSLVIGSASGNLGRLVDAERCCPDGGDRLEPYRTIDRVLVNVGIVAYVGAGSLATYNVLINDPPAQAPRLRHNAHRWLALAHGAVFAVSMTTGIIMSQSQENDPRLFAGAAKVHVASNVVLVPLLSMALANILFE